MRHCVFEPRSSRSCGALPSATADLWPAAAAASAEHVAAMADVGCVASSPKSASPRSADANVPAPKGASQWRTPAIVTKMCISGGFAAKSYSGHCESMTVATPDGEIEFVRVAKDQEWLLKTTAGPKAQNGTLKRSRIIDIIKRLLQSSSSADEHDASPAVAGADLVDDDPMNQLDGVGVSPSAKKRKVAQYRSKRAVGQVRTLVVNKLCPQAHPQNEDTITIKVMPTGTQKLWLAKESIPWLVRYVSDEVSCGGVPLCDEEEAREADENTSIPGLRIEWDFAKGNAWRATFFDGSLKGNVIVSSVEKLTQEKWDKVASKCGYEIEYCDASESLLKQATYQYLLQACQDRLKEAEDEEH